MMKRIRTFGAAVVALAAPVLLAAPAAADTRSVAKIETRLGDSTTLTIALGAAGYDEHRRGGYYDDDDWHGDYRRLNQYGQTEREVRDLSRSALQACRQAVRYEARELGYRDVEFDDDQRVRQISRRGFLVHFDEVEFEGRRSDRETRVICEVRRGNVVAVDGIPLPHRGRGYDRRW